MARDEVMFTYEDSYGNSFEAHRVGESFAVREALPDFEMVTSFATEDGAELGTHVVVYIPNGHVIFMPNEELAWFFADQLAMHVDGKSYDEQLEFMKESRPWANEVLETGVRKPYRHWLRERSN